MPQKVSRPRFLLTAVLAAAGCGASVVDPGADDDSSGDQSPMSQVPRPERPGDAASVDAGSPPDGGSTGRDATPMSDGAIPPAMGQPDGRSDLGGGPIGTADAGPARPAWVLPVLLVDVGGKAISKGTKIAGKLRVIEDHDGTLANITARPATLETPIGIEHRGQWSLQFPKKSFSIELRDDAGVDRDQPFLGMPAESDWVLRAGYYDRTLMRDALGFWLFQEVWGRYASRFRFVELYIDGKYMGVYLACEKIKRGKFRVNLPKVAPDAASGDLTGGYFVHIESGSGDAAEGFKTSTGRAWEYGYPRPAEITPAQATYLRDFFDRFERAMGAADFADPTKGYARWADLPSWIDFALFEELARNTDGYTKSSYYQKLPDAVGGKVVTGPIWDNDLSFGILSNGTHTPEGWLYEFKWNMPVPWWEKLWRDPPFRNAARCRWQDLRKARLSTALIDAKIDELAVILSRAQPRENARWMLIGKKEAATAYAGPTWADDIRYLKTWIAKRLAWLDTGLSGACTKP